MRLLMVAYDVTGDCGFWPSFGANAAGSTSDDTVNVWQVSVIHCAVPGAHLRGEHSV